jgi:hypothetical protein
MIVNICWGSGTAPVHTLCRLYTPRYFLVHGPNFYSPPSIIHYRIAHITDHLDCNNMSESTKRKRHCICFWQDCDKMASEIKQVTEANHVWNGELFCNVVGPLSSVRAKALRLSIVRHLKVDKRVSDCRMMFVARHHWPIDLLEYNVARKKKSMSIPLTEAQAEHVAKKEGRNRLVEECNKIKVILKEECDAGDQHSFVQAPLSKPDNVRGFINSYTSRGALRLDTRPAFITPASIGLKHNLKRKDSPSLLEVSHMQSPQVEQKQNARVIPFC